jgi:hypothetical protein
MLQCVGAADNQDEICSVGLLSAICKRLKDSVSEEEALAGCAALSSILYEHGKRLPCVRTPMSYQF